VGTKPSKGFSPTPPLPTHSTPSWRPAKVIALSTADKVIRVARRRSSFARRGRFPRCEIGSMDLYSTGRSVLSAVAKQKRRTATLLPQGCRSQRQSELLEKGVWGRNLLKVSLQGRLRLGSRNGLGLVPPPGCGGFAGDLLAPFLREGTGAALPSDLATHTREFFPFLWSPFFHRSPCAVAPAYQSVTAGRDFVQFQLAGVENLPVYRRENHFGDDAKR
jgi:hypothetical protein